MVNFLGYVKISDEALMTFNVVSWKGVLMPEVQEPITMLIKFPANEFREISFYIGKGIFVKCDR